MEEENANQQAGYRLSAAMDISGLITVLVGGEFSDLVVNNAANYSMLTHHFGKFVTDALISWGVDVGGMAVIVGTLGLLKSNWEGSEIPVDGLIGVISLTAILLEVSQIFDPIRSPGTGDPVDLIIFALPLVLVAGKYARRYLGTR